MRLKASFIGRLVWQPFDVQFGGLLNRLKQHRDLFELEVSLSSTEESLRFYAKYEEDVHRAERQAGSYQIQDDGIVEMGKGNSQRLLLESNSAIDKRARKLQEWINPPRWMDNFEQAQNRRAPGTCEWILDDLVYKNWRKTIRNPTGSLGSRTLHIQGTNPSLVIR